MCQFFEDSLSGALNRDFNINMCYCPRYRGVVFVGVFSLLAR